MLNNDTLWVQGDHLINERGQLTHELFGNGVVTARGYTPSTGRLQSITSGRLTDNNTLNRLNGDIQALRYAFDRLGNLTERSDLGPLVYNGTHNAGIHAVTASGHSDSPAHRTYAYDRYGNMTQRGGESLTYSVFNKPLTISGHSNTTEFRYGPNHQRFKQISGSKTTYTINGGAYEEIVENGTTTQKTYIGGFLVHTQSGGNSEMTYLHKDHLGSTDAMTDSLGNLAGQMSFGVWGQRQQSDWQSGTPDSQELDTFATTQGYTGHQQLDDHDLIHMGGRVYDPTLGRFLSADLYVQSPYNSQSFNRYSYTFNNPLSYTDPTGYRSMAGEMVIRGQTISDRQRDAIMASNRQMLFTQQYMQQFVREMIGQGESAFTYTMEDGQKYVVHIDAEAFEAGTTGGGAANDSSVGTGNSHSDDSESRNGRGMSLDERERGFAITDAERKLLADGKIQEFWESRLAAGDPVAKAGLDSLDPDGGIVDYLFGGTSINNRLQAFANVYANGVLDIGQIRVELANAHINFTDNDTLGIRGLLNPGQIAEYHHNVFRDHGLPPTTFGGTPFTGAVSESWFTAPVWCGGCDTQ